jgi:hypothetical protein
LKKLLALSPAVQKQLRALPDANKVGAVMALLELGQAFGNPHVHSGLGIRKLKNNAFECRAGLARRFGFVAHADKLTVMCLGNHDLIRRWIRDL